MHATSTLKGAQERSDDMTPACDAVELSWILRKVTCLAVSAFNGRSLQQMLQR